ncbi:MAG: cytochrome ubiquinol oxidase subunit I, partial [Longispora sp.]|nr:cytochrome ubiquinol oxidase subunit I [Longispora sp. (in: high G+C Gram-positive bacteria)]
MQTAWYRTGDDRWLKLTKFYGKLFLINFAMGVVTGIVQEFQFGMNWSAYSRFVGDVFGAPLAIEGLLAFFLESTFLGLWIFGWDRLHRTVHLACIWLAAIGSVASAYFILAANSFMQWPVGYTFNPDTHRAELTDIGALLTNKVLLITFPHTLAASLFTAGALVAGIAVYHLLRGRDADKSAFRTAARLGAWTALVAAVAVMVTGDIQGKIMTATQPMKMAAAEALYNSAQPADFSLLTVGTPDGKEELWSLTVPGLLSWLATGDPDGQVHGINDIQAAYTAQFGPGDYTPYIPVTYWGFRTMIGLGMIGAALTALLLWKLRRGRTPNPRWALPVAVVLPLLPLAASSAGWIFTEMGRQPWAVFGLMTTANAVSPTATTGHVLTSLIVFTLLYAALAVVEVRLLLTNARNPLPEPHNDDEPQPAITY